MARNRLATVDERRLPFLSTWIAGRQGRCAFCDEPAISSSLTEWRTPMCDLHVSGWHRWLDAMEACSCAKT